MRKAKGRKQRGEKAKGRKQRETAKPGRHHGRLSGFGKSPPEETFVAGFSHMLALGSGETGDDEPAPKQPRCPQQKQELVGGVPVRRSCGGLVSGRQVLCADKTPRCTQAWHRQQQELKAAAAAEAYHAAFDEGVQGRSMCRACSKQEVTGGVLGQDAGPCDVGH